MKKFVLLTLMIPVVFCAGCTTKEETPPETPETPETLETLEYFDFTVEEFVDDLEEFSVDLKFIEEQDAFSTYSAKVEGYTPEATTFYFIHFDSVTKKVSKVSISVSKTSIDDIYDVLEQYYYNVGAVAGTIDIYEDTAEILGSISWVTDENETYSSYLGEKFHFFAMNGEQTFVGLFSPNNT